MALPAPPPPCGLSISGQIDKPALVKDCEALLAAKDALRGTGALNWATGTAIGSWDGVTVGGTPERVTKLKLANKSLTGIIPKDLEKLDALAEIKLSGNTLTGCIPASLKSVATNDLSSLSLPYCMHRAGRSGDLGRERGWPTPRLDSPDGSRQVPGRIP